MSRIQQFGKGVKYFFAGFSYLATHPRLIFWAIIPTAINLILLAIMIGVFSHYFGDIYSWLTLKLGLHGIENPDIWWKHLINAFIFVARIVFQLFIIIASLILLLVTSYAASLIVAGPFNDMLSERVEALFTGISPPRASFKKFISDTWRTIKAETVKALILIFIPIALFILNFIPIAGAPLYIALTFLFGSWELGFCYTDLPMGRLSMNFDERFKFARRHKWALMGLGVGFIVPFSSLIFTAPLVAGGTLLYLELKTGNRGSGIGVCK